MAKKPYDWKTTRLDDHSKQKHKVIGEYFRQYLITRCKIPQQEKFRLSVVDAFSGAGKYACGNYGSPLIFIETLKKSLVEINTTRAANGMKQIEIECLFIFNDADKEAIELLKENVTPFLADIKATCPQLHVQMHYFSEDFDKIYTDLKTSLQSSYGNVMFNLDQYGSKDVNREIIKDIFQTWKSAEAFLTFSIGTVLTYISMNKEKNSVLTKDEDLLKEIYALTEATVLNKKEWLALVEKVIFSRLGELAPYSTPFSIHNKEGWRYWLLHFANSPRARQVFNDVLHENSSAQIHIGRSGLRMLSAEPSEGTPYLFDTTSREAAKKELYEDIPRLITEQGDAMNVGDFRARIYNETPAHSDDINAMILANPDLEVLTSDGGGARRSANAIRSEDTIRIKSQKSFSFPLFLGKEK